MNDFIELCGTIKEISLRKFIKKVLINLIQGLSWSKIQNMASLK